MPCNHHGHSLRLSQSARRSGAYRYVNTWQGSSLS